MQTLILVLLTVFFFPGALAAPRDPVIFDTDSAYFMDDGAALAMLLSSDKVEVLGITTVIGNLHTADGVRHIFPVLQAAGYPEIPVYMGSDRPMVNSKERVEKFVAEWGGVAWLGAYRPTKIRDPYVASTSLTPRSTDAVDFIVSTVRERPGRVTILALGPLTNVARALQKAPDLAPKIKRVVIMGGNAVFTASFTSCPKPPCGVVVGNASPLAEFNFWFDPEAAQAVLRSDIPEKLLFGLDVTNQAKITKNHYDEIIKAKTPVTAIFEWHLAWKEPGAERNVWDTVPAAYLLDPSFMTDSEEMYVDVITQFGPAYGALYAYRPGSGTPGKGVKMVTVMKGLDFPRWYRVFKAGLMAAPRK